MTDQQYNELVAAVERIQRIHRRGKINISIAGVRRVKVVTIVSREVMLSRLRRLGIIPLDKNYKG